MGNLKSLYLSDQETFEELLNDAVLQLERNGFVNDETSKFASVIQHNGRELIEMLNQQYEGVLNFYAKYYDGYGAVYWIYDEAKYDSYEAFCNFTNEWVNEQ